MDLLDPKLAPLATEDDLWEAPSFGYWNFCKDPEQSHKGTIIYTLYTFIYTMSNLYGLLQVVPGINKFVENGVEFVNGKHEEFDSIILATGYKSIRYGCIIILQIYEI